MKIRIDTREQRPWSFPHGVDTVVGTVHQGDYAVDGDNCFAIERKSAADFRNTVVRDWDRLQDELHRMDLVGSPNRVFVVECDFADFCYRRLLNKDLCSDAGEAARRFTEWANANQAPHDSVSFSRWMYSPASSCPQPNEPVNGTDAVFTPQMAAMRVAQLAVWNRACVLFCYDADIAALMAFQVLLQRNEQLKGVAKSSKRK